MAPVTLPPGFRFHPTDEELVAYYLDRKISGRPIELAIIPDVDLYKCEPWDLPEKSFLPSKDMEWYFFSPRDRKYPNGSRTNRATKAGYWKATGKDRLVKHQKTAMGMKKTLVYYKGRAPHGIRTNWVMHEYRIIDSESSLKDAYALCRIFRKMGCKQQAEEGEEYLFSGGNNQERESGEENCERDDCRFPSDTCSSELTEGSPIDNGGVYNQEYSLSATDEGDSSTNASPARMGSLSISTIAMEDCRMLQEQLQYPPLAVEDFPQMDPFDTTAAMKSQTFEEYLLGHRHRDFLSEAHLLEEIFFDASSSHGNSTLLPLHCSSH